LLTVEQHAIYDKLHACARLTQEETVTVKEIVAVMEAEYADREVELIRRQKFQREMLSGEQLATHLAKVDAELASIAEEKRAMADNPLLTFTNYLLLHDCFTVEEEEQMQCEYQYL